MISARYDIIIIKQKDLRNNMIVSNNNDDGVCIHESSWAELSW